MIKRHFSLAAFTVLLTACGGAGFDDEPKNDAPTKPKASNEQALKESADPTRYQHEKDFAPLSKMDPNNIPDAVPRKEVIKAAGNKSPYMVFGKVYHVMPDARGYKEQGGASWYGLKFHGHKTSNGEIYDIHGMTAAHKTLPIPSYVKVTNVANGRSAIVRVNDRGPFHDQRIIDLSYAAATKLGYIQQGVAQVIVEAIDVDQWDSSHKQPLPPAVVKDVWLQLGAYSQAVSAHTLQKNLVQKMAWPSRVDSTADGLHRVRIGPVAESDVPKITQELQQNGFPSAVRIKAP